jgi:hypothetical protein
MFCYKCGAAEALGNVYGVHLCTANQLLMHATMPLRPMNPVVCMTQAGTRAAL